MHSSAALSRRTDERLLPETCRRDSHATGRRPSEAAVPESCRHSEADRPSRIPAAELDARTRMLLEQPIAPLILRLALPNATVMTVQILIGLLEVYFVSRTGVAALAGVAPVFPLVSLVV